MILYLDNSNTHIYWSDLIVHTRFTQWEEGVASSSHTGRNTQSRTLRQTGTYTHTIIHSYSHLEGLPKGGLSRHRAIVTYKPKPMVNSLFSVTVIQMLETSFVYN